LAYRRRALPLIWSVHRSKHGVLPAEDQIALLHRLVPLIPVNGYGW
jgi:hypothetical protein